MADTDILNQPREAQTGPMAMKAQVERDPQFYEAILHQGGLVGETPVHILEVVIPDSRWNHYYLVRKATQEDLAHKSCFVGGVYVILIRTQRYIQQLDDIESIIWYVVGNWYGYSYDETIEDAQKSLVYWQAHPDEMI